MEELSKFAFIFFSTLMFVLGYIVGQVDE